METRIYTAWELAGEWWWVNAYEAVLVAGRSGYETATATRNGMVALRRALGLRTIVRYVEHDAQLRLRLVIR